MKRPKKKQKNKRAQKPKPLARHASMRQRLGWLEKGYHQLLRENAILMNGNVMTAALSAALVKKGLVTNDDIDAALQDIRNGDPEGSFLGSAGAGDDEADGGDAVELPAEPCDGAAPAVDQDGNVRREGDADQGDGTDRAGDRQGRSCFKPWCGVERLCVDCEA